MKTLVIVLAETRAVELTFQSFKENLLDRLDADLCVCIGVKPDYDYENPFYKHAKYKFLYNEPDDYGPAFEGAYREIRKNAPSIEEYTDENGNFQQKSPLYWREFLKIPWQYMGGIKDPHHEHPGSAGILIFFRWFLLQKLQEHNLISQYDRFIITRSDYIYQLPHVKLSELDENYIWVPDEEHYGGITDRHTVLSKSNIVPYLSLFHCMVLRSNEYFNKMAYHNRWNLEQLIQFHLKQNGLLEYVREFPYVMYTVRPTNGVSRWRWGNYSEQHGYFIKYETEYKKSSQYKTDFENSGMSIDKFYKSCIKTSSNENKQK